MAMGIQDNIDARKQRERDQQLAEHHGEQFVTAMLAGWRDVFKQLSPAARKHACHLLHDRFANNLKLSCGPEGIDAEKRHRDELRAQKGEAHNKMVEAAIKQAKRISSMCDELPSRAEPFATDVADGVCGVLATIEERWDVTDAQQAALDNWEDGVSKWIR